METKNVLIVSKYILLHRDQKIQSKPNIFKICLNSTPALDGITQYLRVLIKQWSQTLYITKETT